MALTREAGDNSGVCEKYDFVVYERLRGHKGQVLCVAAPGPKVKTVQASCCLDKEV